jgi:very-short-patch-repair endonuclease
MVPEVRGRVRGLFVMRIATTRVRELRAEQTEAETAAWYLLRNRRLGLRFHRQYPIDKFVVDFYCFERRLAIELDGGVHSQPSQIRKDLAKDAYLRGIGIIVLRLPNGLVLNDPGRFIQKVIAARRLPEAW